MKLYIVRLKGMKTSSTGTVWGESYVVANDPTEAYEKVKAHLVEKKIGFEKERELDSITLIADAKDYSNIGIKLYL